MLPYIENESHVCYCRKVMCSFFFQMKVNGHGHMIKICSPTEKVLS